MQLPPFKIEEFFTKYEFSAQYMLGSSDAQTHTLKELVNMADPMCKELWENLPLSYTEYFGSPLLLEELSKLYTYAAPKNILVFAGAEEAIYVSMKVLLNPGDHVVIVTPCYESLKILSNAASGNVTECPLQWVNQQWVFDFDKFQNMVTDKTRLIIVNFPHNPTGFLPDRALFDSIIDVARKHNAYLFCDEVYRLSEQDASLRLPNAMDCYERALSVGVMSKSFGLPGLRIGWVATQDTALLKQLVSYKNYTSMCNSAPSELLTIIALRNRDKILARNIAIAQKNLILLNAFFKKYAHLYEWTPPQAGFVAFPRLKLDLDVDIFAQNFVEEESTVIISGKLFDDSNNHFRVGFGRENLPEALERFERYSRKF